jgi:hypothetical protein
VLLSRSAVLAGASGDAHGFGFRDDNEVTNCH